MIEIYTDGASTRINPKDTDAEPLFKAGWAITWTYKGTRFVRYGFLPPPSSNNRGELTAVIEALKVASRVNQEFVIYSDSQYCVNSITKWYSKWLREGKDDIKNPDLMKQAYELYQSVKNRVEVKWVRGHSGVEGNEIADEYAVYGKTEVIKESTTNCKIAYV